MESKRDLEIAAHDWMIRCQQERERVAELEHALNLLVNDSVVWFAQERTKDGAIHDFGIGIAMEVPIENPFARITSKADVKNVPVAFWRTTWPNHRFMSAVGPDELRKFEKAFTGDKENVEQGQEMAAMLRHILPLLDKAQRDLLERRKPRSVH
jgi:hypothetical protein